jgi:hypothetical protein
VPPRLPLAATRARPPCGTTDVFPVALDDLFNVSSVIAGMRSDVRDRSTEPDILADQVCTARIFHEFIDIGATDASVGLTSRVVMIRHAISVNGLIRPNLHS